MVSFYKIISIVFFSEVFTTEEKRSSCFMFTAYTCRFSPSLKECYAFFYTQKYTCISEMSTNVMQKLQNMISLFFVTEKRRKKHDNFMPKNLPLSDFLHFPFSDIFCTYRLFRHITLIFQTRIFIRI